MKKYKLCNQKYKNYNNNYKMTIKVKAEEVRKTELINQQ